MFLTLLYKQTYYVVEGLLKNIYVFRCCLFVLLLKKEPYVMIYIYIYYEIYIYIYTYVYAYCVV